MDEIKIFFEKIKAYDYVSFDVFDTLIYRTVSEPYRQLKLVEWLYKRDYNDNLGFDFMLERIKAENVLRNKLQGKEVTLKAIYDNMQGLTLQERNSLMKLECFVEISNCVPNKRMLELANLCRNKGKQIIIVSDMYLPKEVFYEIFSKIKMPYDNVFISCEVGETKRTGKIFPYVLNSLGISASQIIHIGDDNHNDLLTPRQYGIETLRCLELPQVAIPYISTRGHYKDIEEEHFVCCLKRFNQYYNNHDVDFNIGYNVLGPFMFDFCQWLHEEKKKNHIDILLFVAREGYLIKKCYELLYPNDNHLTHYVRLSRNMLRIPMLSLDNKLKIFLKTIPEKSFYEFGDLISYLYLSYDENFVLKLKENNVYYDDIIYRKDIVKGKWNSLFSCLFGLVNEKIELQQKYLKEYLLSFNIDGKNVALVNNSMNGSAQSMLEQFCAAYKIQTNFIGLQFVRNRTCTKRLANRCHAWITDSKIVSERRSYLFQSNCLVLEHLMFEPMGTALYMRKNGKVDVYCEPQRSERKDNKRIQNIQEWSLKFIEDYSRHIPINNKFYGLDMCLNLLHNPLHQDAKILCSLNDDDVEGDKVLSDLRIPFSLCEIFKHIHHDDIRWIEGYYAAKNINCLFKVVANIMSKFFFYRYHRYSILNDLKFFFS